MPTAVRRKPREETLSEFRPTPRVSIRRGSIVRFHGGGPVSSNGRMTLPGRFRVREIRRRGRRVWLDVIGLSRRSGEFTVFVAGRAYRKLGLLWRPYKVRRAR